MTITIHRKHPDTNEDMRLDVKYDVEPYEPMTHDCPGCEGGIIVTKVTHNGVDVTDMFDLHDIEIEIEDDLSSECDGPDEPDFDPDAADREADRYFGE